MKFVLACAGGLSTSMLVKKIAAAAEEKGIELDILATAVAELEHHVEGADIILLGPQVSYQKDKVTEAYPNIPVYVMNMLDYGTMNGAKVLNDVLPLIGK